MSGILETYEILSLLAQEGMLCIDYNITFTPVTNEPAFVHCSRAMSNGQVLEHHRCFEGRLEKEKRFRSFFKVTTLHSV